MIDGFQLNDNQDAIRAKMEAMSTILGTCTDLSTAGVLVDKARAMIARAADAGLPEQFLVELQTYVTRYDRPAHMDELRAKFGA